MHETKLTKIVATIGPASDTPELIKQLILAGVNVFRFNTKHSTPEWHSERINRVQSVADALHTPVAILLDLQGPEIRLETRDKQDLQVKAGELLSFGSTFVAGINVIIPHRGIFSHLHPGSPLLIDDGFVETEVVSVNDDRLTVKIMHDSVIKHRKGVNLPGVEVDFPALIENDIKQLDGNARNKVDYVGLSFVRSAKDIELLRSELTKRSMTAQIVAKIESQPALDNIDPIISAADAIMVARGDLGVEVPLEQLAYWQKTLISKARQARKPVITATQMLESMITHPRPTRAEATDVAHAVFDGTDAVMLSAETASGNYPVRCVETMARIAHFNEGKIPTPLSTPPADQTQLLTSAAVTLINNSVAPIDAILVFTETGYTARALAAHHLPIPVIAATDTTSTCELLTLSFGITPVKTTFPTGPYSSPSPVITQLLNTRVLKKGQTILIIHGHQWQEPGNTNAFAITTI